jgi:Na+/phosphate symporter
MFWTFAFVEDGQEKSKALDQSIKTVGNLWWGVFGDYLAGALVLAMIVAIPISAVLGVIGLAETSTVYIVINLLSSGLISFLCGVFLNLVYRKYKGYNG